MTRELNDGAPDYPELPQRFGGKPQLFIRGVMPPQPRVAIVGTRSASADGMRFARDLSAELAGKGISIVSGGAHGIDTAAHRGALDVDGSTVVVIASGLDQPMPPYRAEVIRRASKKGCVISEWPLGEPTYPARLLQRNRLIAALAEVTVVIEAPARSGALSTAAHARELGASVFAVPHFPMELRGEGCNMLLAGGARVCTSARDVLSVLAPSTSAAHAKRPKNRDRRTPNPSRGITLFPVREPSGLDADTVLQAFGGRACSVDELADKSGLPAARVFATVTRLLLDGIVESAGQGLYRPG